MNEVIEFIEDFIKLFTNIAEHEPLPLIHKLIAIIVFSGLSFLVLTLTL